MTAAGPVELWHQRCFERRHEPIVVAPTPVAIVAPPDRRRARRAIAGGIAVSVAAIAASVGALTSRGDASAAAVANVDPGEAETLAIESTLARNDRVPPPPETLTLEERYPIPAMPSATPDEPGVPLDETFVSLQGWVHPVTGSDELMPGQRSRQFGSGRAGIERAECGAGHCGVDLDGPRGRPIVAVAGGIVIRVERKELGADGRSGRYVRVQHDDGAITAYMHLDDVAADLDVRDRVAAGQYLGTLGATAVYSAPPHLHFSLELPERADDRGDGIATTYVDPAPFLVRATVAKTPERRHAVKPAF